MTDPTDSTQYDLKRPGSVPSDNPSACGALPPQALKGVNWKSLSGGRFEPRALLGRGGFAMVYRAYDRKLGREVALKILYSSLADDCEAQHWLEREGMATASLQHPHIVTLHDYETTEGSCYLVTELVNGKTLAQFIQEHPEGCDPRIAVEIIVHIADALAHAHSKNVVHRDIKPSNILLDFSLPVGSLPFSPRLADFGLATVPTLESLSHSASGLMGTIHYLPPEIVNGLPGGYTPQGDIYALTAVLRELLTGQKAVHGLTFSQIINQIAQNEFDNRELIDRHVPADVIAICSQGMSSNSDRRYATASLLAQDLWNFLRGEPVLARTPGIMERWWRSIRRHPAIAATGSFALLATLGFAGLILSNNCQLKSLNATLDSQNHSLELALSESQKARYHNEQIIYALDMAQATQDLQKTDLQSARAVLDRYADGQPLAPHRDVDWQFLSHQIQRHRPEKLWQAPNALYVGTYSSDGKNLVLGGQGSLITSLDADSGGIVRQWDSGQAEVNGLAFDAKDQVLWSTGDNGTVCAWAMQNSSADETIQPLWRTKVFADGVEAHDLIYLVDIHRLVVLSSKDQLVVMNASDGEMIDTSTLPEGPHSALVGLPDGRSFLAGDSNGRVRWIDGATLDLQKSFDLAPKSETRPVVRTMAVCRDKPLVAVVDSTARLHILDLDSGSFTDRTRVDDLPRSLFFYSSEEPGKSDDSIRLLLSTRPGIFHDFDVSEQGEITQDYQWATPALRTFNILKRPHLGQVASLHSNGDVLVWPITTDKGRLYSEGCHSSFRAFQLKSSGVPSMEHQSPKVTFLIVSRREGIECFNLENPLEQLVLDPSASSASLCDAGPEGLWVADNPTTARRIPWKALLDAWPLASQSKPAVTLPWQEIALPMRADGFYDLINLLRLVASQDGKWLGGYDSQAQCVWLMRSDQPEILKKFPVHEELQLIWFEPGSSRCWWIVGKELHCWDTAGTQSPRLVSEFPINVGRSLAVSPDNTILAIKSDSRTCYLWDIAQQQLRAEFLHEEDLKVVSFSLSGRTVIALDHNGNIVCWNLASGRKTYEQQFHFKNGVQGGFSSDRQWMLRNTEDDAWHFQRLFVTQPAK